MWKLSNTLTNNQWVKRKSENTLRQMKIKTQGKKCIKYSKKQYKNENLRPLNTYLKKNNLKSITNCIQLGTRKEQAKPEASRRKKTIKTDSRRNRKSK